MRTRTKLRVVFVALFLFEKCCIISLVLGQLPSALGFMTTPRTSLSQQRIHIIPERLKRSHSHARILSRIHATEDPSKTTHNDDDDRDLDENQNHLDQTSTEKLWLYVYNLQKARKSGDMKPAKSLAYYLKSNPIMDDFIPITTPGGDNSVFTEACERALTQALRAAGETGDYRLVLQLVDASIEYANGHAILTPRIFGEALDALSKTQANVSKMKYVWNLAVVAAAAANNDDEAEAKSTIFLSSPLTAFELNVLLKSLASRGKARACAELYRQHATVDSDDHHTTVYIQPDAYTASTLFSILTDSVNAEQKTTATTVRIRTVSPSASFLEGALSKQLSNFSPCWQWNTAVDLLSTLRDDSQWNNHVYSSLFKLQDRAQELFDGHKNGPHSAMAILDSMIKQGITPDVVTCTLVLKAIGDPSSDPNSYLLASRFLDQMKSDSNLPFPNEYSYSAAIVACARCSEYDQGLELLEEMRNSTAESSDNATLFAPPQPNTWVYNAALLAVSSQRNRNWRTSARISSEIVEPNRRGLALRLLQQMKEDHVQRGMDTRPDTVTYNTVFATIGTTKRDIEDNDEIASDNQIFSLVKDMKSEGIPRDAITYRNAVLASSDGTAILRILHVCLEDSAILDHKESGLEGRAANGYTFVFNAALSMLASRGNLKLFKEVFSLMQEKTIVFNGETTTHLVNILGRSDKPDAIAPLLIALSGSDDAALSRQDIRKATGITLTSKSLPPLAAFHYTNAISACLVAKKLKDAQAILTMMRQNGVSPTVECLQSFALAYARAATRSASKEAKNDRKENAQPPTSEAQGQAQKAYSIVVALDGASSLGLSQVARACVVTGEWAKAQSVLRLVHTKMLTSYEDNMVSDPEEVDMVCGLHSALLRECARQGNVSAALWYANDIQRFERNLLSKQENTTTSEEPTEEGDFLSPLRELRTSSAQRSKTGMRAEDWVSLVKAASKSGHWRVCINTLQFLRPDIESTNSNINKHEDQATLDSRYEELAPALTAATRCLEIRSQYAWAVRSVQDWMDWSGRKPRPDAILATIRILSARGRGEEVKSMLFRCVNDVPALIYAKEGVSYEEMLYIGTVTALHNNGHYDDADEVFISGISQGYLPFAFGKGKKDFFILDLHGLNVAMAHSAVRVAMRQQVVASDGSPKEDMVIITGKGRNSALRMRPVLRPEVQRMLLEEFYPPFNTISVPGNMGAVQVSGGDISAWQAHQQEQTGARMLTLAALLKNLSQDRLRRSIALAVEANKEVDSN